jgi:hypothetical protein
VGDIKIGRLESVCHITRLEEERATKTVLNGKFHNTRSVGKPRIRWEHDGNITYPRNKRMEVSNDREQWRSLLREARAQKRL